MDDYSEIATYLLAAFCILAVLFIVKISPIIYFLVKKEFLSNLFNKISLNPLSMPLPGSNILIFVPHPDDEAAGCSIFIKKAVENGCKVKVVLITNGDGVGLVDVVKYRLTRPGPEHFEKVAYMRQRETIKAMSMLGLQESDIIFLGYPDRCSHHLWRKNWYKPYTSAWTKRNYSFYNNSYTPGASYTGTSLANDIEKIIRQTCPTHIVYPHFFDVHVDHFSTNNFVKYAICKLDIDVVELTYLIHRGNWPVPPGKFPFLKVLPPKALVNCGIKWYSLDFSKDDLLLKEKCLLTYRSQVKNFIMRNYLLSFMRQNELFAVYNDITLDFGNNASPEKIIHIVNPFSDTLKGYSNKSADICDFTVSFNAEFLKFEMETLRPPKKAYSYIFDVIFFDRHLSSGRTVLLLHNGSLDHNSMLDQYAPNVFYSAICHVEGKHTQALMPLKKLPRFDSMLVNALTFKGNQLIDRTGARLIKLRGRRQKPEIKTSKNVLVKH